MGKKILTNIVTFIILALIVGFLFRQVFPKTETDIQYQDSIVTKYITNWYYDTVEIPEPEPILVEIEKWDTILKYRDVDTAEILRDYFAERTYDTTLVKDSTVRVRIQDVVTENRLVNQKIFLEANIPTIEKKIFIKPEPRTKWYVGVGGVRFKDTYILSGGVTLVGKRSSLFSLYVNPMSQFYSFNYQYQLKF